jgi:osmotically-inducible protein OsmY
MLSGTNGELARGPEGDPTSSAQKAVEARIRARLDEAPYGCLRRISCELQDGVLALRGRVPSHYLKQVAQSLLCSIEGVREIRNELDVTTR